ncbi:MAG: NlpC/P60 family protein, partial [Acidimicrobiales bacterium]
MAGALVAVAIVAFPARAGADPIAAKRAEAARIAEALDRQGDDVAILAEQFNVARIEADQRAIELATAAAELQRSADELVRVRTTLKGRLVEAYASGGGPPVTLMSVLAGGPAEEMAVRRTYVNAVAGREQADVDGLTTATEAHETRRQAVESAEAAAAQVLRQVEGRRRAAEAAVADQRATLSKVNGELTELVEAEKVRRAEAEARQARAEVEARQARERAAAQARLAAGEAAQARLAARATSTTTTAPRRVVTPTPTPPSAPESLPPEAPAETPAGVTTPVRPPAAGGEAAVAEAKRQLGKPYEYGSPGPDSFDCSGLTSHAWRAAGKSLPHSSQMQMA